ncbi:diguanylate cyclase [Vibrio coralliilyticus]|uniref:diguanylate cyclase n=1 Tax=Vibrio coralliilyticus TaxID=190893 RepID=A0A1V0I9V0_9VIBR|nr:MULTISPECIES: diguanylate cyclase [Vibrio]ARC92976.1 diguanylate cyclase response regulator [Vibrio coralliilyticus]AXN31384.1 diguanylate cyclase response regulator [Vibrio coralliilyticus]ERB62761.1 diguanylate cyclase [Vibrio coralliilyticus OCN008]KFI10281.1 diguanylate cyclase [Vibrio sp. B183]KJY75525.1 diguanylate cyclase [Vibrio coralliilyticus]
MNHKVLVVEDSRAYRNYLTQQLTTIGCDVVGCESYAETQKALDEHHNFHFAVLDYCLPDAQDGEVIDLVLDNKQKVIVLTATFSDQIRERFIAKGVMDYLLKDSMASVSYLLPLATRLMNNVNHHALVVDDSPTVRKHVAQLLEHQYIRTTQAQNGSDALHKLAETPDITFIITDHDMPSKDGIVMTREIRQMYDKNSLAILGLSGSGDRTLTARFLKAGANDFLHKPFNQEEFFCRVNQLLDMKEATDELYKLANQDTLTGLWNRRFLFNQSCTEGSARYIAMLDIDHFKSVNDTFGHDGGDAALKTIANILKIYFPEDVVVRFGGEEFCVQSYSTLDEFITRLEKMRQRIENSIIKHNGQDITLTISIGVCSLEGTLEQQIKLADDCLYVAKEHGRNQIIATE